jgi:hypothetical protein
MRILCEHVGTRMTPKLNLGSTLEPQMLMA